MNGKSWSWIGKYVLVIIVALFLGVILGNLSLFKTATLGSSKLTAALLVRFIAHMTALALAWVLGWQAAQQMRASDRLKGSATIVVALVSLVLTAIGYVVLSNFINPFISKDVKEMVSWVFIVGVFAAASWFVLALFAGADELIAAVRGNLVNKDERDAPEVA